MDLYERQQFGQLLETAVERFAARAAERQRGWEAALDQLRRDAGEAKLQAAAFVEVFFADSLLDNVDGACFVLRATPSLPVEGQLFGTTEEALKRLAKESFGALLLRKAHEVLEQRCSYQSI
ncbi:MAG: hypothetical protein KDA61_01155 [Planctomycetales bacterium]|nr:hypothetical protein [Planctomycetales bacterium]